jgi:hypothetical protein
MILSDYRIDAVNFPIETLFAFSFCYGQCYSSGTNNAQPWNCGSPSMTTKALGIFLPFFVGKVLPVKAFRSLMIAITRLRLGTKSINSAAFGSDVQGLMQPAFARNPCPGWIMTFGISGIDCG